jgi:hypothetical protein
MRSWAGIIQRFPTGTDEVEYCNVTKTKKQDGVWFGTQRALAPGDIPASSPGGVRDNEEFSRAKNLLFANLYNAAQ